MPVSIKDLKSAGVYSGAYKALFTAPPNEKTPLIKKLEQTLTDRTKDVRTRNLSDYRTYWAIDVAHEISFSQTTPTLVQSLLSRHLTAQQVQEQLKAFGLSEDELFLKIEVPGVGTKLVLNPPLFFQIFIPVVKAYHAIRTASIYAERDTSPFFKFVPLRQTDRNRVICDIWSDIADTISTWYGFPAYLKQAIQQMLKYGVMLAFPLEEWHVEEQVVDGDVVVQKEGLRYAMPHPTRMGWDLSHPLPTINSDTGIEWGLHWHVARYGDVLDNRQYWNRRSIMHSSTNWFDPVISQNYFQEVFPCQLRFPVANTSGLRREDKAAFYSTADRDYAVFLTTVYWKLIPRDWGLSEYRYPVWHRFDLANDDTVIWAAPCAYNPMWFMGFDFDSQAGQHSSLSLEAIPWQDHLGNLLSQMILTAKQNLVNIIYYDRNLVDKTDVDAIKNLGENRYRSLQFIGYDSLQLARGAAIDARNAFHQVAFQPKSIVELQSMISTALTLMERILQFTAQETGATAAHYQSKGEVDTVAGNASTRKNYTASGVDEGRDAWRLQTVTGAKAYLNDGIVAQVSSDIKDYDKHVTELGFALGGTGDRKVLVSGSKSKLPLEAFARSNIGPEQTNDRAAASAIMQALGVAFQNEQVFAQVGAKRIIKMLELAARLAGAPSEFDVTSEANDQGQEDPAALMQKLAPAFQQLSQTILGEVQKNLGEPVAKEMAADKQRLDSLEAVTKKLEGIWRAAGIDAEKLKMQAAELEQSMSIEKARFEAEQTRLTEQHQLDMQLAVGKAGVDAKVAVEKAQSSTALAVEKQHTDLAIANAQAAADAAKKATETATKLEQHDTNLRLQKEAAAVDAEAKKKLTDAKVRATEKTAEAQAKAAKTAASKPAKEITQS